MFLYHNRLDEAHREDYYELEQHYEDQRTMMENCVIMDELEEIARDALKGEADGL